MAPTQSQLVIQLSQTGFIQTLVKAPGSFSWEFPVIYEVVAGSQAAEVAQINLGGVITKLVLGQPSQIIKGSGSFIDLAVELGPKCAGVKILSNPHNESGCKTRYPLVASFVPQHLTLFQVACVGQMTNWTMDVNLQFSSNPESPPTSANVSLVVDGHASQQVPEGQSSFNPSGSTLAFTIMNFQGDGQMKIVYTLQAAAAAS